MSLISKRVSLLVSVALFAQVSSAQLVGLRPVGKQAVVESAGSVSRMVDTNLANKVKVELAQNSAFRGLDEMTVKIFVEHLGNKSFERIYRNAVRNLDLAKGNSAVAEIERTKIEIISSIKDMDMFDEALVARSADNNAKYAEYLIIRTLVEVNPVSLGKDGQEFFRYFVKELSESLKIDTQADRALSNTLERMSIERGLSISLEDFPASLRTNEGIAGLFKGVNDTREYEVGSFGEQKINLRLSEKEAQALSLKAQAEANRLIEIANNPGKVNEQFAKEALQGLRKETSAANQYLEKNTLLNNRESVNSGEKVAKDTAQNLDELLMQLKELGSTIDGNKFVGGAARFADKIGLKWVAGKLDKANEASLKRKTIREKILMIDRSIVEGIEKLEENNLQLDNIRAKAIDQIQALQIEIARVRLVSDTLHTYVAEIKATRPELARTIESEIIPRIEKELNSSLGLYGILRASVDAIDSVIKNNLQIISDGFHLRNIAIPAIAVTESVKQGAKMAQDTMERHKRISMATQRAMEQMVEATIKTDAMFAQMAGETVIKAEVLEKVYTDLIQSKEKTINSTIEAGKNLRKASDKLAAVMNKFNQNFNNQSVGTSVESMIQGSKK